MTIRIAFLLACLGLFAANAAAQADVSNNEIEGFRFSTEERVKGLSLLVSRKEDVMAIFGKDCEHGCRFNDDWDISFAYVNYGWSYTKTENGKEVIYKPNPSFLDKLADINFKPRREIVLPESTFFPPRLQCLKGEATRGTLQYRSIVCTDHRTLTYFIYGETDPNGKFQRNQIYQITYLTIPTDKIYTLVSDTMVP